MTVRQLIDKLREMPAEALVLTESSAPEQGFNHVRVTQTSVTPSEPEGYWDGEFRQWRREPRELQYPAVILERHHEKLP